MDIIGLDAKWYKKTYPYTGTTYCGEEQTDHLQEKQTTKERGQESSKDKQGTMGDRNIQEGKHRRK